MFSVYKYDTLFEYKYEVDYSYVVDGVTYYGHDTVDHKVDEYDWIEIYYDQKNPEKSDAYESGASSIIALVVIGAVMYYGWQKRRKLNRVIIDNFGKSVWISLYYF